MKIDEKDTMNLYESEERNMEKCEGMKQKKELLKSKYNLNYRKKNVWSILYCLIESDAFLLM